ncbi:hypothetical protein MAL04_20285 (plasmid) [Leptospira noguchii]|nr:hypothetical protein MAL04_20285 [Leptospira noguchii]
MEESTIKKGYVLGEAVKTRETAKRCSRSTWNPEVRCIYFDPKQESLVKVRMLPEDLERVKEILPYLPK